MRVVPEKTDYFGDRTLSRSSQFNVSQIGERKFVEAGSHSKVSTGEFDPGSERTLAAGLTHASRTRKPFGVSTVANG